MKGKNKKLIAVFVVPVVLIAAVAGYYLYEDEEPLRIEEGYAEVWLEDLPGPDDVTTYPNVSATATTYINNDSVLKFDVTLRSIMCSERSQLISLNLSAKADISENLNPSTFKFTFRLLEAEDFGDNFIDYRKTNTKTMNVTFVYEDWISSKSHALNFDVNSNKFNAETLLVWDVENTSWGAPATLEITASIGGFSEEVVATVHVHIGGDEI